MAIAKDTVQITALLLMAIVGGLVAIMWLTSKWRRATDALQKEYIATLEKSRDEAVRANKSLTKDISELRGVVGTLERIVLMRCPRFTLDAATGGCTHCDLGYAYGRQGGEGMAG